MFRNYFYILRSIVELEKLLKFYTISEIYSQEKNTLFFSLSDNQLNNKHLIISTDSQFPYLKIKDEQFKAKKNVINFLSSLLPAEILSFAIAKGDRIVRITTTKFNVYFSIKGSQTNVFFINDNDIVSFKKNKMLDKISFDNFSFFNSLEYKSLKEDKYDYSNLTELKLVYPMISKEIKDEIIYRQEYLNSKNLLSIFQNIADEIIKEPIVVFFSEDLQKTVFYPFSFKSIKFENLKIFNDYNSALNSFLSNYYVKISIEKLKKDLGIYFEKELTNLSNKLNKLSIRIEEGSKEKLYFNYGNILLSNRNNLKKGIEDIELTSDDKQMKYKIKLDPKLTPQQNIDKYFEKSKDEKMNFLKSKELFNLSKIKYDDLLKRKLLCENSSDLNFIKKNHSELIKKSDDKIKMDSGENFKYWHYVINEKYHVYIGRDSKSNDYLSIKFAKQNDYWFHARGVAGSHTILRINNQKEVMPKEIIKKTASLAAFYSKAKTSSLASVSYTFAKFVHKKKGMEPGKVLLSKENTVLVKPSIPQDCELLNE